MAGIKNWIEAARLRTLPLSISGILVGSGVAFYNGFWNTWIFTFSLLTTILFQVLSNFANDLGDGMKGTDNDQRIGPARAVQSGAISKDQMKKVVILFSSLSMLSALSLIYFSSKIISFEVMLVYVGLAIASILAAILYTVGKKAYGYHGLGDIMVFVFFGCVSVLGVYTLYSNQFLEENVLLAIFVGLLSTAVLNLNNMRDYQNDKRSNKNTIVVKMGPNAAKFYHMLLVIVACASYILFISKLKNELLFICAVPMALLIWHLYKVMKIQHPKDFDPELKVVALSTFALSLSLFIGLIIAS